jgi:hypothetical protein
VTDPGARGRAADACCVRSGCCWLVPGAFAGSCCFATDSHPKHAVSTAFRDKARATPPPSAAAHPPRVGLLHAPLCRAAQIDQAALTGESLPVKKFTGDVAYSGSTCKAGERHCLVYATGRCPRRGRTLADPGA